LLIVVAFSTWLWPAADEATLQTLSVSGFWHALWPASVGAIGAWAAWTLARKANIKLTFRIPAGDILIAAQWVANQLGGGWSFSADRHRQQASDRPLDWRRSIAGLRVFNRDWRIEIWLRSWDICGIIFLSMLVVIFIMLALA
jgi:hypothetical protein